MISPACAAGDHPHCTRSQQRRLPGLLEAVAAVNPSGDLYLITDNLYNHKSPSILDW